MQEGEPYANRRELRDRRRRRGRPGRGDRPKAARAGAKVVVADLADDKGKALESELGVRYVPTDATSEESVNAAIAEAASLARCAFRSTPTAVRPAAAG